MAMRLICCLLIVLPLAAAASPQQWPEHTLRGANLGIFPGGSGHYSEEDIAHLALDWRANSVRILINDVMPSTAPYRVGEATKADLFRLIDLCLKYRLYTVIAISTSFDNMDALFGNPEQKAAFADFWVEIATRYADSSSVAYDLYNEPHDNLADTQWSAYAAELTAAVRAVDSVHTIVVEPPGWGWPAGFDNLTPTGDENTVYSFHFYGPMDFTHQRWNGQVMNTPESVWRQREYPGVIVGQWETETWNQGVMRESYLDKAVAFREKNNVRLWCGEFGCARWALGADKWFDDWVGLLEEEGIDWAYYSYREWHHMDIEMDPAERVSPTERSVTPLTKQFMGYFTRNEVPLDFDRDGTAGLADVLSLISYQMKHPGSLAADFNRDGRANIADAMVMLLRILRAN